VTDTDNGPYRVGGHWGVTIIYDPEHGEKTGTLWAVAQTEDMAEVIVAALNLVQRCAHCAAGMVDVTGLGKPAHSEHVARYTSLVDHTDSRKLPGAKPNIAYYWPTSLIDETPAEEFPRTQPGDVPEPRTWTASDLEPPEGIDVLYDTGTNPPNPYPYLCRRPYSSSANAGWGWRVRPEYKADGPGSSIAWYAAASTASGPLIEHHPKEEGSTS
jgi:hypothetical protein